MIRGSAAGEALILAALAAATFTAARAADARLAAASPLAAGDPLYRLLGSSREMVGDALFLKADAYFHGGAPRHFEDTPSDAQREGRVEEDHAETEEEGDWISRIRRKVAFEGHYHLTGNEKKEIVPFLIWAVELDPYNATGILSTAYWLDHNFKKTDEAARILEKGVRDNPAAWEIEYNLGKLDYRKKKDAVAARPHLKEALRKTDPASMDKHVAREIYYMLGECESELRNPAAALVA